MDVKNCDTELPSLYATFNLTYINTELFEENSKSIKHTDSEDVNQSDQNEQSNLDLNEQPESRPK